MLDKLTKPGGVLIFESEGDFTIPGKRTLWKVEPSSTAKNCKNLIRQIVDELNLQPNPEKPVIALSLGWFKSTVYQPPFKQFLVIYRRPNHIRQPCTISWDRESCNRSSWRGFLQWLRPKCRLWICQTSCCWLPQLWGSGLSSPGCGAVQWLLFLVRNLYYCLGWSQTRSQYFDSQAWICNLLVKALFRYRIKIIIINCI